MNEITRIACQVGTLTVLAASIAGAQSRPALGPVDGKDLPPLDTGRVGVGTVAPDFTLEALNGTFVRLSELRDKKNVVLVFYRGHW